jgi:hypothetical protein
MTTSEGLDLVKLDAELYELNGMAAALNQLLEDALETCKWQSERQGEGCYSISNRIYKLTLEVQDRVSSAVHLGRNDKVEPTKPTA